MQEELQTALADLISKTLQGVDASKDFLTAEVPDVIQQLLTWHGVYSAVLFLLGCLYVIIIVALVNKVGNWMTKNKRWGEPETVFLGLTVFLAIPPIFLFNLTWLQIWIAPKVWLIEYVSRLIK